MLSGSVMVIAEEKPVTPQARAFFEERIRPVLATKCYGCHSVNAPKIEGRLLLDTREGTRKGGVNGPAVVPGDLMASLLISAIRWHEPERGMPPKSHGGRLPSAVIADFEQWVLHGAPDPRIEQPPAGEILRAGSLVDTKGEAQRQPALAPSGAAAPNPSPAPFPPPPPRFQETGRRSLRP